VPDWVPKMGGKGWDVPDIPMLAKGGIVTRPTLALIGEAGPEAVVPLNGRYGGTTVIYQYEITVNGAVDKDGVGKQIEQILAREKRLRGKLAFQ